MNKWTLFFLIAIIILFVIGVTALVFGILAFLEANETDKQTSFSAEQLAIISEMIATETSADLTVLEERINEAYAHSRTLRTDYEDHLAALHP